MNQPLLHVMIPAYGKSPYLRKTLESAVKNLSSEVLISVVEDPHSEFDLKKIVDDFPRVTYFKNPKRLGVGGNFNKCIELSQGKFTQICGSDDEFTTNPLNFLNKTIMDEIDISAIGFDVHIIDENNKIKTKLPDLVKLILRPRLKQINIFENKKIFNSLMLGDWLYFPAILWRTEKIKLIKFSGDFHTAMDLDILIRLLNDNKKICFIKEKTINYRRHNESASSLYAKSIGRFEEEFYCHEKAIKIASEKKWKTGQILARLSITIRLHALLQSFLLFPKYPKPAIQIFKIVFKVIH
jgi:glycosyltransferase involved in cell wall biosynthesis